MTQTARSDPENGPLSKQDRQRLARLVACIIPASTEDSLPGADDPAIFAEIVQQADALFGALVPALKSFAVAGEGEPGAAAVRRDHPRTAQALQVVVAQCYYRDPRVMRAIGMEARPPFPAGFEMEPNDFTQLEPVRRRVLSD